MKKLLELTEEQLLVALRNVGCFLDECGACAEQFYCGSTSMKHECPGHMEPVQIVFTKPPSHQSGQFVEVENEEGKSVRVGSWQPRSDGWWNLLGLYRKT